MNCIELCKAIKHSYRHESINKLRNDMMGYFATKPTRANYGIKEDAWQLDQDEVVALLKRIVEQESYLSPVEVDGVIADMPTSRQLMYIFADQAQAILDKLEV